MLHRGSNCSLAVQGYMYIMQCGIIRRVSKHRLFIRDLLFIERFTFSGDDVDLRLKFAQTRTQFDAEFLKSAFNNDYLPCVRVISRKQIVKSASFVDPQTNVRFSAV